MGGEKLDERHFSHDSRQLFVRVDRMVITDGGLTFFHDGKPLFCYDLPQRSAGGTIEINLSPRSCIEIQVTS